MAQVVAEVRIREAEFADAAQMGRVFVDSYTAANRGIVSAADLAGRSYAQSAAAWERGIREIAQARHAQAAGAALSPDDRRSAGTIFYVAETIPSAGTATGAVVGVAATGPAVLAAVESTVSACWLHDAGEVSALYVAPACQRRGVGRELVRAAAAYHHQAGRTRLTIAALARAAAPRFYQAIGGRLIGRCHFPDEDGSLLEGVVFGWLLPAFVESDDSMAGPHGPG